MRNSLRRPHGWLNIAEIELSTLQSQCLKRRIPSRERLQTEISAWEADYRIGNAGLGRVAS
jgi:hypothetical protein